MKTKMYIVSLCIVVVFLLTNCSKQDPYYIGFAEDQSSHMSSVYTSLTNGRKLQSSQLEMNRHFRFVYYDTKRDPENAANAFRDFFQKYDHGIMMGTPSAECAQVSKFVADVWDRTFVCNSYQTTIVDQVKTTLLMNQNPLYQGTLSARYLVSEMNKQRICVVVDQSNEQLLTIKEGFTQEGNSIDATIMEIGFTNENAVDPNTLFAKISQSNVDAIFLLTSPSMYQTMILTARKDFAIYVPIILPTLPNENVEWNSFWEDTFFFIPFFDDKPSFVSSSFYQSYLKTFGNVPDYYAALGADEMLLINHVASSSKQNSLNGMYKDLRNADLSAIEFLTGLKGFDSKGLSLKPIDIVRFQNQALVFQTSYWHECTKQDL
ncbi:MAG: ABC transporter substrate-binding protein [Caldisericia bacterium]|nr:ABC transporter substrate-binding protein [Caldisericia bacterium]MDD4614014.1 ABC transporter substrate-binding protein [Caldisericia bacterium]